MLLPRPARVRWQEGEFRVVAGVAVAWSAPEEPMAEARGSPPGGPPPSSQVRSIASRLAEILSLRAGFTIPLRARGEIRLVLEPGVGRTRSVATEAPARELLPIGSEPLPVGDELSGTGDELPGTGDERHVLPSLAAEAYTLRVTPHEIEVTAAAPIGLFRGMQTLLQLLPEEDRRGADRNGREDSLAVAAVTIADRPRFRWRGLHLDVARHFFPVSRVKGAIDWCALHKLNVFHWHLTDDQGWRLPVVRYPRLTEIGAWRRQEGGGRHGGAYTADEIREVVEYAAQRFVTIVPEIEMPGHARAALAAYPALSCRGVPLPMPSTWGIFEDVFCAGKEETFTFLEAVLDEVAALFPGPFVHIGGDECPKARWIGCPDCLARLQAEGLPDADALAAWFVRRIGRHLARLGKRLVGWDEILDGAGRVPGAGLPPDAVVMSWRGFQGGVRAARAGHDVVMSPSAHCYLDHYQGPRESEPPAFPADLSLEQAYRFEPVPPGLDAAAAARILGGQGNTWTERMSDWDHVGYMVFPRLCALAEALWSPAETRDESDFLDRLRIHAQRLERLGIRHGPIR